jgi:hypothetical protein
MRVSHEQTALVTPLRALDRLQAFLAGRWSSKEPCGDMECFERELHEYVVEVEREVLAEELARLDVDLPAVMIEGELYRQVENSSRSKAQFEKYRHLLREEEEGVEKVIRALCHLRDAHPRKKKLSTELAYFRRYRHRMRYAKARAQNLPIGSGVVEAACKTLATERMKRSGMRWRPTGGQAILTLRALHQSARFERGWKLLSRTYKRTVVIPENVMLFPKRTGH